jgi:hypothetical protein
LEVALPIAASAALVLELEFAFKLTANDDSAGPTTLTLTPAAEHTLRCSSKKTPAM